MQSVNPRSQESHSHPIFFHWGWFLSLIILGQLILSFGANFVGDGHQILGVFVAFTGSIILVQFAKPAIQNYWDHPIILSRRQINGITFTVLILFLTMSLLNYWTIQIGYDADEILEFGLVGLPAYKHGWLWWAANDETLTHNINAFVCHLFSIRFGSFKLTALFFRTGAGIFAWLLATELFGKKVGLWCGLILTSSVMYLCSFDSVIKEISVPMVFLACLFFTFRGLRTTEVWSLFAGGLCAGLVPYTYVTRIAMAGVFLCWPFLALMDQQKTYSLKNPGRKLLWWVGGFLLLIIPFVYYLVKYPKTLIWQSHVLSQSAWYHGGLFGVFQNMWSNVLAIMFQGDPFFTRNFDRCPMLWWPWACAFWIGLAMMLQRIRESRMAIPLLLMATLIGMAGLTYVGTPNFKFSRTAMLLATFPAALGIDFLAVEITRRFRRSILLWTPLLLAAFSFQYGWHTLQTVMTHPVSWWFRDTIRPREAFVDAHPHHRIFGVGSYVTDMRAEGPVTEVSSLRQVLETPGDGRDVIFLFPDGREEWQRQMLTFWQAIYPGGQLQRHTVPVSNGNWPVFISYKLPASQYWFLPSVPTDINIAEQASIWWQRAELLHRHGLIFEAWCDALRAAHLDPRYYPRADHLLGNQNDFKGRLEILIRGNLWNEAGTELTLWEKKTPLTPQEASWLTFLTAHGLELRVYSTYTASEPVIASFRQYMPEIHIGYTQAIARKRLHFAARAEGQLYVPKAGHYRFEDLTNIGNAQTIAVDGVTVVDTSTHGFDVAQANPIYLKRGLHSFSAENCSPFRMEGAGNKPAISICIPNSLSYLYGFDACWWLKWQYEQGPIERIPPEYLYAPGAHETPLPNKL